MTTQEHENQLDKLKETLEEKTCNLNFLVGKLLAKCRLLLAKSTSFKKLLESEDVTLTEEGKRKLRIIKEL